MTVWAVFALIENNFPSEKELALWSAREIERAVGLSGWRAAELTDPGRDPLLCVRKVGLLLSY